MATRILAVLNQKGGVGKTTTCVNLGAALARRGFRVLLVDMDPQANLTVHLGLEPPRLQRTSYSLLLGQHRLAEAVHETGVPGLSVVPSTLALANAEIQLASTVGRELVLREALEEWLDPTSNGNGLPFEQDSEAQRPAADFILIDCPPSLGTLTMNALCAAGEVLLPIQTEFFALQGVAGILESVRAVQRLNKGLRLSMVVPSLVDLRTTLARDVIDEVRTYFGDVVTKTVIRKNVKLAEAPSHGKTIFEWEPRCNGAQDYEALAAEVLGEPLPDDDVAPKSRTKKAARDEPARGARAGSDAASDETVPDETVSDQTAASVADRDDDDGLPTAEPLDDSDPAPARSSGISIAAAYAADAQSAPGAPAPAAAAGTVTRDAAVAPADTATSATTADAHAPPASRIELPEAASATAAPADTAPVETAPAAGAPAAPQPGTPEPGTPEPGTPEPGTPEPGAHADGDTSPPRAKPAPTHAQRASWWSALRRGSLRS